MPTTMPVWVVAAPSLSEVGFVLKKVTGVHICMWVCGLKHQKMKTKASMFMICIRDFFSVGVSFLSELEIA